MSQPPNKENLPPVLQPDPSNVNYSQYMHRWWFFSILTRIFLCTRGDGSYSIESWFFTLYDWAIEESLIDGGTALDHEHFVRLIYHGVAMVDWDLHWMLRSFLLGRVYEDFAHARAEASSRRPDWTRW
jgi:hypothetical protein